MTTEQKANRIEEFETSAPTDQVHREAITRKTQSCDERVDELQAREFEKGAHLLAGNVEEDRISVEGNKLERITKDDGKTYFRLPGEDNALGRGGSVVHSTAGLLPLQRLARYDDEMLASVTNRKPDELASKAWRERDEAGRYSLWSTGSGRDPSLPRCLRPSRVDSPERVRREQEVLTGTRSPDDGRNA